MIVAAEDAKILQAVLWFANLREISSTEQVAKKFRQLPVADPDRFENLPSDHADILKRDQELLRHLLNGIANKDERKRDDVAKDVAVLLSQVETQMVFDHERRRLTVTYALQTVQECCALAVAIILDEDLGLANRLGKCGAPDCGRFRLDLRNRPGRPWRHCNAAHRKQADRLKARERVKGWRLYGQKPWSGSK